ncbi:MAG TPA: phosphoribosyltransferase family protein [Flavisolibacter sp.]|nr:phosphoribosyltransferase family protein [Flavisolibacter sp.]
METAEKNHVLDREAINRKLRRMALEVAEQNIDESHIVIAGIAGNGQVVADSLVRELKNWASFQIESITIQLNKKDPLQASFDRTIDFENKVIIVVDDVANTGRTILYALKPFLSSHPKKIQTLVLVERSHKLFPVQTDYAGLSIATTLQEHIFVEAEGKELTGAYLK